MKRVQVGYLRANMRSVLAEIQEHTDGIVVVDRTRPVAVLSKPTIEHNTIAVERLQRAGIISSRTRKKLNFGEFSILPIAKCDQPGSEILLEERRSSW